MATAHDLKPKYLTQEEATAVVELWARLGESRHKANLLTLTDLSETLQITEEEAERLLQMIRSQPELVQAEKRSVTNPLPWERAVAHWFVGITAAIAGLYFLFLSRQSLDGFYMSGWTKLGWVLSGVWFVGWLLYYRRPILRSIGRFLAGKP